MNPITTSTLALLALSCSLCLAQLASADELDDKLAAAAKFNDGDDASALKWIEEQAVASLADPQLRTVFEERLLAILPGASTRRGKDFLCRMLRIAGTEKSIPALEKMLPDRESSHMARYVLASMRNDAATAALHRSLKLVPDDVKPGIIDSLGDLRYQPATSELVDLLETEPSGDHAVRALGLIGGQQASGALKAMLDVKKGKSRYHVLNALLRCAASFEESGDERAALAIYDNFADGESETHVILSGLRGIARLKGEAAVPLLATAMKGENRELANGAAALIASIEGKDIGKQLKALLASALPDTQVLLIGSLAARGDLSAIPEIARLTKSESQEVRIAAIRALGQVGDASTVKPLAAIAATSEGFERNVVRAALASLDAEGVSEALQGAIRGAPPEIQGELVRAIVERADKSTVDSLFEMARSDSAEVRKEALRGLGRLAGENHLHALLALLLKPKDVADRADINTAIAYALRRVQEPNKQAAPLLGALTLADADSKAALLALLGRIPTPASLAALRKSLSEEGSVQRAGIEALSKWPDATPAADLLTIASQEDNPNRRAALDGYIVLAAKADDPTAAYDRALKVANTPEIAKQVLAGLGSTGDARALAVIEPHLSNPDTKDEAAVAAGQIAHRIKGSDAAAARAIVVKILASGASDGAKKGAADLQAELERGKDN